MDGKGKEYANKKKDFCCCKFQTGKSVTVPLAYRLFDQPAVR